MKKIPGKPEKPNDPFNPKYKLRYSAIIVLSALLISGCGLFGKKNFEDTDTYKELMRQQEETDRKLDSIRKDNYKQLNDSTNGTFKKELDSLKRSTDSLKKELDKSLQDLKHIK
jgi:uncharacterized protein YlxW (UPF0749 family)